MHEGVYVPPFIHCPRCGGRIILEELVGDDLAVIKANGYIAGARGVCECGVVAVLCVQEMPRSPTFSLFFDIYAVPSQKTDIGRTRKNL